MYKKNPAYIFLPILFIVFGGVFLLYFFCFTPVKKSSNQQEIVVTSSDIQSIRDRYKAQTQRVIGDKELQLYIEKEYYEKMLLDQAYKVGLEKDDAVIKQILVKKMKNLLQQKVKVAEPTQEQLKEYYKEHIEDYSHLLQLSFENICEEKKGKQKLDETYKLLLFNNVNPKDASSYGSRCRLSNFVEYISFDEAKLIYGEEFATKIFHFNSGVWHNAIQSKLGEHFVYITAKRVSKAFPFDEVKDRVYKDYIAQQQRKQEKAYFHKLVTSYKLNIE